MNTIIVVHIVKCYKAVKNILDIQGPMGIALKNLKLHENNLRKKKV